MGNRCLCRLLGVAVALLGISGCSSNGPGLTTSSVSTYRTCSVQEVRYCDRRRDQACECMSQQAVNDFKALF